MREDITEGNSLQWVFAPDKITIRVDRGHWWKWSKIQSTFIDDICEHLETWDVYKTKLPRAMFQTLIKIGDRKSRVDVWTDRNPGIKSHIPTAVRIIIANPSKRDFQTHKNLCLFVGRQLEKNNIPHTFDGEIFAATSDLETFEKILQTVHLKRSKEKNVGHVDKAMKRIRGVGGNHVYLNHPSQNRHVLAYDREDSTGSSLENPLTVELRCKWSYIKGQGIRSIEQFIRLGEALIRGNIDFREIDPDRLVRWIRKKGSRRLQFYGDGYWREKCSSETTNKIMLRLMKSSQKTATEGEIRRAVTRKIDLFGSLGNINGLPL